MTQHRVLGIETEYGVLQPGHPGSNPVTLSAAVVAAYAHRVGADAHTAWDYEGEDPLSDARGFRVDRSRAHASQLTDGGERRAGARAGRPGSGRRRRPEAAVGDLTNAVLTNGARLYVDHAHPEYSSPEVRGPRAAVVWDRAGEEIMRGAIEQIAAEPAMPDIVVYKNNVDGKGQSYGTHENYLVDRDVAFADLITYLTPFLVTRQVFCGAGRVGIGPRSETPGFQISQRADYIENDVGLETTFNRPIVNTRDEPHADASRYRRLHLIIGDANLLEISTYLKLGTTDLLLWLIESGRVPLELDSLALADPVGEVRAVSRDLTLSHRLTLADGRTMTALEIQRVYLEAVATALAADPASGQDAGSAGGGAAAERRDVLRRWSEILGRLTSDPMACAREVEWIAKLRVSEAMRRRDRLGWDDPRLAALDVQWSDVRAAKGIYARLAASGAVDHLVSAEEVSAAVRRPPADTRAWLRGESIRRFGRDVAAAGWSSLVLDDHRDDHLLRIELPDPGEGRTSPMGARLRESTDTVAFAAALAGEHSPTG